MTIKDTLYRIDENETTTQILNAYELTIFMGNIPIDFAIHCAKKYYGDKFSIIEGDSNGQI